MMAWQKKEDEIKQMAENVKKIVDSSQLKAQTADEVNTALAARNMDLAKRYETLKDANEVFSAEMRDREARLKKRDGDERRIRCRARSADRADRPRREEEMRGTFGIEI